MIIPKDMRVAAVLQILYNRVQAYYPDGDMSGFRWALSVDVIQELMRELSSILRDVEVDEDSRLFGIPVETVYGRDRYVALYKDVTEDIFE